MRKSWSAELRSLVSRARACPHIVLLCHQNADPDAVCSAHALKSLLNRLVPKADVLIVCPEGIGASTRKLMDNLGILVPDGTLPERSDLVLLVDTNTLDQLGEAGEKIRKVARQIVVVDHHHPHPETQKLAAQMIVDESASAAAEVVFRLWKASGETIGREEAMALLAALFVETRHFVLAGRNTFEVAARLVRAGADPRYLSEMLDSRMSRSERIARLKGCARLELQEVGDWIVATSELGSYQSSAAKGLLGLGAHLAFVGGQAGLRVRVNMRSTEAFHKKTGVHLGRDIAIPVSGKLGGHGGGHPTAAGLSASEELGVVIRSCVEMVRELLTSAQR